MIRRLPNRFSPVLVFGLALLIVIAGCSSDDSSSGADDSADPGVSTPETSRVTNTSISNAEPSAEGDSGGDTIAFCSLAADAERSTSRAEFLAIIDEMLTVAPPAVLADSALASEAWSKTDFEPGVDAEIDEAIDRFVGYQLDECGIVASAVPPS